MSRAVDVLVVGGGLDSLVAATTLARAGRSVVLCERLGQVGGAFATDELAPGFRVPAAFPTVELLHPEIVDELDLERHGLRLVPGAGTLLPLGDGRVLHLDPASGNGRGVPEADREAFAELEAFVGRVGKALAPALAKPLPQPVPSGLGGVVDLLRLGWGLRRLGAEEMPEAMRLLPMPVRDVLDERLASEPLKAVLAAAALPASWLAPRSAGSAYGLLHHRPAWAGGLLPSPVFAVGGPGALAKALAAAASEAGVEIRTEAAVERIVVAGGAARGARLAGGEELQAARVLSGLDPKRTLLGLAGPEWLQPDQVRAIRNVRSRGSVAIVQLALSAAPRLTGAPSDPRHLAARIQIGASQDHLERAFDAAKYGRMPEEPWILATIPSAVDASLAPNGHHVLHAWVQHMPPELREGDWEERREELGDRVVGALDAAAPGLAASVLHRRVQTPADLAARFGITGGCLYHAELALDQLLYMRPIPGWFRYATPLPGLYLCGPGTHPGGGGTGLPGRAAATELLASR